MSGILGRLCYECRGPLNPLHNKVERFLQEITGEGVFSGSLSTTCRDSDFGQASL